MARLLRGYLGLLERHPFKTTALSTGTLMGTGDVIAQFAVERKSLAQYEFSRTSRFLLFGTVVAGPALRGWYMTLEKVVKLSGPSAALAKVTLDQCLFAPGFCALFLSTMGYWRTQSVDVTKNMLKESYVDVMIANYKLWPAAQIINFYLVPLQHRVMYVNCVALLWNTYLAWRAEKSHQRSQTTADSDSNSDRTSDS